MNPAFARNRRRVGLGAAGIAGTVAVLEAVSRAGLVDEAALPPATTVLREAGRLAADGEFPVDVGATMAAWFGGLALAVLVAVPLGVLLGSVPALGTASRGVDALQLDTARAFGVGRVRRLTAVVLPAAAPKIFAGLRVALSFALILMVLSELFGSTAGVGSELIGAQRSFELPRMWAGIVTLGVLGLLFNGAFVLLERRLLGWHAGARRPAG